MAIAPLIAVWSWVIWQERADRANDPPEVRVPAPAETPRDPAVIGQPKAEGADELTAFDAWLSAGRHEENLAEGLLLAHARREALKALIQSDPEAALDRAVPYALRRDLPAPIVALLEIPVSRTADLDVEQACGGPEGRSWRHLWLNLDGRRLRAFAYGHRATMTTKQKLSVHGIAIDEVMAMRDDPLRELSAEETADLGHEGRVVQLGRRHFAVDSEAALESARQRLRAAEEVPGPEALPAYRELALGEMAGLSPLAMQDGQGGQAGQEEDLPPALPSPWTEGAKTMLYIRARFADELPTYEPVTLATAQARQAEAEAFWFENSYGKSSLSTTYTGVVTLPKNGGDYVGNFNTLIVDAREAALAANPAWNHANFHFFTIVTNTATNAQGNGFAYAGIAQLGGKASHLLRFEISVRTASHEYGHNLGLFHSGYWLTDSPSPIGGDSNPGGYTGDVANDERNEYGHKFAVMGSQPGPGDFDAGRAHYAASDKNRLDWLATAAGDIVSTTTSGTFRLYRHDVASADFGAMTTGVARAVKIDRPATDPTGLTPAYKYWLNYRMLPTNGIAGAWLPHGLQVDWRRDGQGFHAVQLDMTPYSRDTGPYGTDPGPNADNNDKEDAVLLIGRTYSDAGADIHFTPIAKGGSNPNEWIDVVVNIGTQGTNTAPQIQNFTVSKTTPATGELVNFSVNATDPNGDTLVYHWDVGDNTVQSGQLNLATRAKLWNTAGFYTVRVEVSDMKGGKATASATIQIGSPANTGRIHGRVTHAGRPVDGVLVRGGGVNAWTGSDGSYQLSGLAPGNVTVTAFKDGLSFAPRFGNPVSLTELNAFGIDFTANEPWSGGGTVAEIRPYHIELPVGFAVPFTAEAFDGSGNPVAFAPTWSVTGGGTISADGLFQAQSIGGPFTVTAQSGATSAIATVTVVAAASGPATNGTWTNASGGSWPVTGNWAGGPPGVVAGGAGFTADFSTLNPTADASVTLDGVRVIGGLVFADTATATAAGWTLAAGTGGSLHLAGANPTITVNALAAGKFASITAPLGGLNGFTKTGAGNLLLNNSTNPISGPVTLSAGNLQLNSTSLSRISRLTLQSGSLVIATTAADAVGGTLEFNGGTLQFNQSPAADYSPRFSTAPNQQYRFSVSASREVTFAANLSSSGGSLTKLNAGTLTLASANDYTGGTTLVAGTLVLGNAASLGTGALSITGASTLRVGGAFNVANALSIATGITGTLDTNGQNLTLSGAVTGAGQLVKTGAGALNISGGGASNTLSGDIQVQQGTLSNDNVTPNPGIQSLANMNGLITVSSGATFNFSQGFTASPLDNALILSGAGTGGLGALNLWRNATVTGPITLADDTTISKTFNTGTISNSITGTNRNLTLTTIGNTQPGLLVSGAIQLGSGGVTVASAGGTSVVTLSGANSYTGDTRVQTGTLRLTGAARIDDSAAVRIDAGAVLHLDFTGTDRVGALYLDGVAMSDGTYGSLSSTADHKSAFFLGNGILRVGPENDYSAWAASQVPPITGDPADDDDHDGIPNLIEYALADGGERGSMNGTLLTFVKRGAPYGGDLTYVIETSTTLSPGSWTAVVTHAPSDLALPVTFDLTPGPGSPVKFARLRVVRSP